METKRCDASGRLARLIFCNINILVQKIIHISHLKNLSCKIPFHLIPGVINFNLDFIFSNLICYSMVHSKWKGRICTCIGTSLIFTQHGLESLWYTQTQNIIYVSNRALDPLKYKINKWQDKMRMLTLFQIAQHSQGLRYLPWESYQIPEIKLYHATVPSAQEKMFFLHVLQACI